MFRCILVLWFCCLLFTSCHKKEPGITQSVPRPVKVVKVEALGSIIRQYTGVVEAREFSVLAFKIPGTLTDLNVQTGQQVKKGKVIARIKPSDYRLQYDAAQANYEAAKSIYERNERLYQSNAVARQNLEIAETNYVRATSALNIARRTLGYTTLSAPFVGFIEQRLVDNFEEVLAGQPIARLVNPDSIEVRFTLPETSVQLLQLPKKIYVEFDSQKGKLFTSDVKEYVYSSNGSGIPVHLIITDQEFAPYRQNVFPGFSCKVIWEIDIMIADKFIIPSAALQTDEGEEYVWVVDPTTSTIRKRVIQTTLLDGYILVQSGLAPDDLIVIAGGSSLQEGQRVKMMEN